MRMLIPAVLLLLAACGRSNVFIESDPAGARVDIEEIMLVEEQGWSWRKETPCEFSLGMSLVREDQPFKLRAWMDGHKVTAVKEHNVVEGVAEAAQDAPGRTLDDGSWEGQVTLKRKAQLRVKVSLEKR
jgi:hypothetical protein